VNRRDGPAFPVADADERGMINRFPLGLTCYEHTVIEMAKALVREHDCREDRVRVVTDALDMADDIWDALDRRHERVSDA
jgi:hypothetical protein